jgi:cyanophycin synthetase
VLTKQLLASAGIPVPDGIIAASADEAAGALELFGAPVVIKPRHGNHGAHVTIAATPQQAAAAFAQASAAGAAVIVEAFVPGQDYRVLVVDGRMVAAAELRPAAVTGDGVRSISQLIAAANADPRRGRGHARELTRITLDSAATGHLAGQGLDADSVPAAGQLVTLRKNANLSTGGTSRDVTDLVHDDVAVLCRRAAAAAGLDICGIDIRLTDIRAPLLSGGPLSGGPLSGGPLSGGPLFGGPRSGGPPPGAAWPDAQLTDAHSTRERATAGAVIELNACPGLRMHLAPAEGTARDVSAAIIDRLYPPGGPARIPVIAVTGTNGKTTTVRLIGHVLSQAGLRVGMATTDGVYSAGRLVYHADASGPRSAEMVLDDTSIEAAVLETARGGIIRGGLGYDQADVAVVTNITADHLGADGVDDLDELIDVKALVAEEIRTGGTVVLNADDPVTAALADRPAVRRHSPDIRFFALAPGNPVADRHWRAGGIVYHVAQGRLVEVEGARERDLLAVSELPGAFGGRAPHVVANALAAVAACRAAGISAKDIRHALTSFTGQANPGRASLFLAGHSPVIVDYGHNAAALAATGAMIANVWGGRPAAAVTLPGDRRDDLLIETAGAVAAWFGAVAVYEDSDKRGRRPGEMQELIMAAVRRARPGVRCVAADGPEAALRAALDLADGQPVLFLHESFGLARAALRAVGAEPWPDTWPPDAMPPGTAESDTLPDVLGPAAAPLAAEPGTPWPRATGLPPAPRPGAPTGG